MPEAAAPPPSALTPVVLCCFGRGGSSLAWRMIGSSPDALMMSEEWHVAMGPWSNMAGRGVRRAYAQGLVSPGGMAARAAAALLGRATAGRACRAVAEGERTAKPHADRLAVKLMDYNIFLLPLIAAGFPAVRPVVLVRDPLAQAESLMRSGLSAEAAGRWCADVLRLMDWARTRWQAPVFHFEDLLADPAAFADDLFGRLDLAPPPDGRVAAKRKAFGDARISDAPAVGPVERLSREELRAFVDPGVNADAVARLSQGDRQIIRRIVAREAALFGYA